MSEALALTGLRVATRDGAAVESVDLTLNAGETMCLVGESGCGKSLTCLAMMGLLPPGVEAEAGSLRIAGQAVALPKRRPPPGLAMIYQDATAALNPIRRIGSQITEAMPRNIGRRAARVEAVRLLDRVGFPDPEAAMHRFPHEFSGGMNQRVTIAMALAARPAVLIADEPTTALDVTFQAQILRLLTSVQKETGLALLFITHDLSVVAEIADQVSVMYAGRIVEKAPAATIFARPQHPYTAALMACRPRLEEAGSEGFGGIPGSVPPVGMRPKGCSYAPRCSRRLDACGTILPETSASGLACLNPVPQVAAPRQRTMVQA